MIKNTVRLAWLAWNVVKHPQIGILGMREYRSGLGMIYDDDPTSPKSESYDSGRELAHIATLRRYDV